MKPKSTIAAIATAAGRGGVGIVRVSGPEAPQVLQTLVPDWPAETPSHLLRLSKIVNTSGELLDQGLVVFMQDARSYTGEPTVEFQCHGGPMVLQNVLDACLDAGAHIAGPGEFTERAYLNGKLDLTQAEAVADLINASSEAAHKLAVEHLNGGLGKTIERYRELLFQAILLVESAIDFSHEEHVYQIEKDEILRRIDEVEVGLKVLRAKFDQGRRQREGVRVVILGEPNAGKSTLFNLLHGTDRAIVTPVAGTTRDYLEEEILLDSVALRLVDTAGLRQTEEVVEAIGIERSRALKDQADLIIWVMDQSQPLLEESEALLVELKRDLHRRPVLLVKNKADLPVAEHPEWLSEFETVFTILGPEAPESGNGQENLLSGLAQKAQELAKAEGVLISRARHLQHVLEALSALGRVRQSMDLDMDFEILALDIREALDALGAIVGRVSTDDILNRIFSEFCVGK